MLISAFLGTSLAYQISSKERCEFSQGELMTIKDPDMGFVLVINGTDWFEQNGQIKSDGKIIHFFEYKKEDKKNCRSALYEIAKDKDNFAERFNESFNYKKLDIYKRKGLTSFYFKFEIENYQIRFKIEIKSGANNEKFAEILENEKNPNFPNKIWYPLDGDKKNTFKYLIEQMAKNPSENLNESNISSDSIKRISNENEDKEEEDKLSNFDQNN